MVYKQRDRQTNRQTDRLTDNQTDEQMDRLTDGLTDVWPERLTDIQLRHAYRWKERQTRDGQMNSSSFLGQSDICE